MPEVSLFFFLVYLFIYLFWEREHTQVGEGQSEGEREYQAGSLLSAQSLCEGWTQKLWDHELSWNQESDAQLTQTPKCPLKFLLGYEGNPGLVCFHCRRLIYWWCGHQCFSAFQGTRILVNTHTNTHRVRQWVSGLGSNQNFKSLVNANYISLC